MMLATLPRRQSDDVSGELMIAAYREALGSYEPHKIEFLRKESIKRCKWFPTVAECIEIMGDCYTRSRHAKRRDLARSIAGRHEPRGEYKPPEHWQPKPGETAEIIRQAAEALKTDKRDTND